MLLFFVGAALGLAFLQSVLPIAVGLVIAGVLTGAYGARDQVRDGRPIRRVAGGLAWTLVAAAHALWVYLAVAWGTLLAWTVPAWAWALLAVALALVAATERSAWRGVRVPFALPLGGWIAVVLLGWQVEERVVRCDDVLALRADRRATLLSPSTDLDRCSAGTVVPVGRFPRIVWEPSEGDRWIVTTSAASRGEAPPRTRFDGSVCEVRRGSEPRCVGEGKAQGIAESAALDRIFVASWGQHAPGVRGRLLAFPRRGPFEVIAETSTPESLGDLYYEPAVDRLYGFTDEGFEVLPFVASSMERLPSIEVPLLPPGAVRYDASRSEGIICSAGGPFTQIEGEAFMSLATRGDPFEVRPLGTGALALATMTWGCDWDPVARRAWVAIPNLGLIATIDYDTGALLRTDFVGFGIRSLTYDGARRRIYATSFLAGFVAALDGATLDEVDRWWVGRFPRAATISRDGAALLVGTNLGVVAIELQGVQ